MSAREDQPNAAKGSYSNLSAPLRGAALAAELLEDACAPGAGDPLRLEIVRVLARGLAEELKTLVVLEDRETSAIEGALRAADVANLAACTVPELLETHAMEAAAVAHLAAGASRALCILVEAGDASGEHARNVLRDARGAAWRARLAVRQVDEFLEEKG